MKKKKESKKGKKKEKITIAKSQKEKRGKKKKKSKKEEILSPSAKDVEQKEPAENIKQKQEVKKVEEKKKEEIKEEVNEKKEEEWKEKKEEAGKKEVEKEHKPGGLREWIKKGIGIGKKALVKDVEHKEEKSNPPSDLPTTSQKDEVKSGDLPEEKKEQEAPAEKKGEEERTEEEPSAYDKAEKKLSQAKVHEISQIITKIKAEIAKVFFGHEKVVEALIRALICNGHVLLEGVPGIAKTLVIKALAKVSGCSFSRVQFTVDLLPTDITGLTLYTPEKGFEVIKGPIFANFIIADEINRATPKTQSSLIEAMQEGQVTIGKVTYKLPNPFFVMANENPLETEGVFSLPEAQIDRFLFKIIFGYPKRKHEKRVMQQNVTFRKFEDLDIRSVTTPEKILEMQKLVHQVYMDERIKDYIINIVKKTRTKDSKYGKYIDLGASPRAGIALLISAKAQALIKGRNYVVPEDIRQIAGDVLRHRLILSYRAKAEDIQPDKIVDHVLGVVKVV